MGGGRGEYNQSTDKYLYIEQLDAWPPVRVCTDWILLLYHVVPYLGQVWLHVRTAGHWTKQLYDYFSALDPIQEKPGKDLKTRMRQSHARGKYGVGDGKPDYSCSDRVI